MSHVINILYLNFCFFSFGNEHVHELKWFYKLPLVRSQCDLVYIPYQSSPSLSKLDDIPKIYHFKYITTSWQVLCIYLSRLPVFRGTLILSKLIWEFIHNPRPN